jgi:hypothetical protein
MFAQAHWFALALILFVALAVVLVRRHLSRFERPLATVRRPLDCRIHGCTVEVEAVQERRSGYFTEIRRCSAPDRPAGGCSQACVQALNAQAAAELAARAPEQ